MATHDIHDSGAEIEVTAHHLPGDIVYVKVAVALAVATALEIAISYIGGISGGVLIALFLTVMIVKFGTVTAYFMHLKFEKPMLTRIFYGGLFLAVAVYLVALSSMHFFA